LFDAARDALSRRLFSPLQGMTFGVWDALRRRDGGDVDPPFRPRAAFQSAVSLANSALAAAEERRFGPRVEAAEVRPPLVILGHWRHGTTHLHNLLARDPRLAPPTLFRTLYPRTFLTTERLVPRLGRPLLLRTRPHDGIPLGFGVPNEDEVALCNDSGVSPYLSWAFPRASAFFDRFLTLRDADDAERARWRGSLLRFLKALSLRDGRPAVLKSPTHTARIRLLLDLLPGVRFVHIRRDPYEVFRSTRHMVGATMPYWRLQRERPGDEPADDRILRVYREMYDAYFEELPLIPPGRSCEVAYEDLERDPLGQVGSIYEALGLPGFDAVRPALAAYTASIAGYRKNRHPPLPGPTRRRVADAWRPCFEAWGYAP
jgi:hypothetical protein